MTDTPIATRTARVDPNTLKLLDLNAHFMRHEVFARLVDNIRRDGGLTGNTPFAWHVHDDATRQPLTHPDGQPLYEVLSGNHRVKAAIAAGLTAIDVTFTDDYLPPARRKAIQLSHNALVGEDDPATLKLIYDDIDDPDLRLYTGLDDQQLQLLDAVDVAALSEAALEFQTLSLTFLPPEVTRVNAAFELARKTVMAKGYYVVRLAEYDRALDALEVAGQAYNVKNTATALLLVLEVFERHLTDLQAGFLDENGQATTKQRVPLAAIFGSLTLPPPLAEQLKRRLAALDADPLTALAKLLEG